MNAMGPIARAVVGRIFLNPELLRAVDQNLCTEDIEADAEARLVWNAIVTLDADGSLIDLASVSSRLLSEGCKEANAIIAQVALDACGTHAIDEHVRALRAASSKRHLRRKLSQVDEALALDHVSPEEAVVALDDLRGDVAKAYRFESSAARIQGEQRERTELVGRQLKYEVQFLDDILRGILPHDLILIGAETGAGKTELAKQIAMFNAFEGKRVHYFALEAEPNEIERRIKFSILTEIARSEKVRFDFADLNYPDWYRGKCEHIVGPFNERAERRMAKVLKTMFTYYRGNSFGHADIKRLLLAIQSETDLVILDHLHYVDIDDENENRGFNDTVKMIRDVTLGMGKPMILVAHLRKKSTQGKRQIVPVLDDFHGSSNITKIVTHAVMLAPARCIERRTPGKANTFIHVPKDRMGGATGIVAMCQFELSTRTYDAKYTLGRPSQGGDGFEVLDAVEVPRWAKHHEGL